MKKTPNWLIKIMRKMKLPVSGNDGIDRKTISDHIGDKTIAESMEDYMERKAK